MNTQKKVTVKKLWHGYVSVRDYIITEAIKAHQNLIVYFNNQHMTIPYTELHKGIENEDVFKSKQKFGQTYRLVDFNWRPDTEIQISLI